MRLIDADDFIAQSRELYVLAGWGFRDIHYSQSDIEFNLSMMPTIEPVRHGRWILNILDEFYRYMKFNSYWKRIECGGYECWACGYIFDEDTNYCPNCGRRMKGAKG